MQSFHTVPTGLADEVEALAAAVTEYQAGRLEADAFKAQRVGFGVYEQRQKGTFMVRVRCTGGGITPGHLRAVARIARAHSPAPLHLTTRQELQLHGVPLADLIPVLRELQAAGLSTRGGGGNGVRNVVVPWDAGVAEGERFDVLPYAMALVDRLALDGTSWQLPRKYKMALVGSDAGVAEALCTDLGFVAAERDGQRGFAVFVAGGMGRQSQTGHLLHEFVPATEAYLVAEALKRVFRKHGTTTDRSKARLRFLWNRLGQDAFLARYQEERDALRREGDWGLVPGTPPPPPDQPATPGVGSSPPVPGFARWRDRCVTPQAQAGCFAVLLPLPNGTLEVTAAEELADVCEGLGGDVLRGTPEQNLALRHVPESWLPYVHGVACRLFPLSQGPRLLGTCVACTGAATCALGLLRAPAALTAVREQLGSLGAVLDRCADLHIAISGCTNACGRHLMADLGFCGRISRQHGTAFPAYTVFAGARLRASEAQFARPLGEVPARVLPEMVASVVKGLAEWRRGGESFSEYLAAGGEAQIVALCERLQALPPPASAPEYYQDWGATEPSRAKAPVS